MKKLFAALFVAGTLFTACVANDVENVEVVKSPVEQVTEDAAE